MEITHSSLQRKLLLTWIIFPVIIIWLTTNYLIGILRPPSWQTTSSNSTIPLVNPESLNTAVVPTIPPYQWSGTGLVTLWFDDGWISQFTISYPIVSEFGYKAALAVPTHVIGQDGYMGWGQVQLLQQNGWEITSHTRTHDCRLLDKDKGIVENELGGSAQDLKNMGLEYQNFVSPCGVDSTLMKQIAKKYYVSFRTSNPGFNPIPVTDPYNLTVQTMRSFIPITTVKSWLTQAKAEHRWLIILIHQVDQDPTSQYNISSQKLHNILESIKEDNIPVVLPTQVLTLQGVDTATDSAQEDTITP